MQETVKAREYLDILCGVRPDRRAGSPGNREATDFFSAMVNKWNYHVDATPFSCLDHEIGRASMTSQEREHQVFISPFSLGCEVTSQLATVNTMLDLESCRCADKILLMQGEISSEQLMPKNFTFYNPDPHKKIYSLLEAKQPAAIVTATERKPELVGALYPFPLIEDGDFNIPSVYCTDIVGREIAADTGKVFRLKTEARRIPSTACNVIACKNREAASKIVVCAHIDTYRCTPGALDNASGTVVLLLLAEMLKDYNGKHDIELVAFNGEDHYSAGGEMDYLFRHEKGLEKVAVAINLDGLGYKYGKTDFSLYECPDTMEQMVHKVFSLYPGMIRGEPWFQGDHMIFVQRGIPSIAITSVKIPDLMASVTHTPKDTPENVDCKKLVEVAKALKSFIQAL